MSTLLDRYERQAVALDKRPQRRWCEGFAPNPITDYDVRRPCNLVGGREVMQDVSELAEIEAREWKTRDGALREAGEPTALFGGFAGLEGGNLSSGASQPLPTALGAVTFVSGDFAPFNGVTYCPAPARSPVTCSFYAAYTFALAGTPGTLLVTAGLGTALSAKNLGASVATATLGTTGTAFLVISGELTIRATGSGTAAAAYFTGLMQGKLATSGAGVLDVNQIFGFTALTYDSTAANGFWTTFTGTATSVTVQTQQVRFGSWN